MKERDEMTEQALESNINDSLYFKNDENDPKISIYQYLELKTMKPGLD